MASLDGLPPELLVQMLNGLPWYARQRYASVCRAWRREITLATELNPSKLLVELANHCWYDLHNEPVAAHMQVVRLLSCATSADPEPANQLDVHYQLSTILGFNDNVDSFFERDGPPTHVLRLFGTWIGRLHTRL